MIISEQWLREWVNPKLNTADLAHQITMAGLEVDAVEPVAGEFSGVIVAEIVSAEQHPDADKLRVCQVNTGAETVQIVCGAPNARVGLKAPLAVVGAVLPGNFKIKKAKLRGVESQGMLCAEEELGLSDGSDGLMELPTDAAVGTDIRDYLMLDDNTIEIGLTPNRADCLGIAGIAREVGVLNSLSVCEPAVEAVTQTIDDAVTIELQAPARCPRYLGRIIRGVDVSQPSPLWMQEKLRRCGVRSIDAVVDVTNYVLLELGQPMHAFDFAKLSGGIVVREAAGCESLTLLDGQTVELTGDTLVIADQSGPLAMAGIMGGEPSSVTGNTQDILLEAAFFTPELMAGKARGYGLHTDSSHRYERGVDFELQRKAIERATSLLLDIVGGQPGPVVEAVEPNDLPERKPVTLTRKGIRRVLGFAMEDAQVTRILDALGLTTSPTDEGWVCSVPSWRFDVSIEADLLEELARIYGYDNLPVTRIKAELAIPQRSESRLSVRRVRRHLAAAGYQEAVTYSFIDPKQQQVFDPDQQPVALKNPISADMAVMRTSLLPGLVSALVYNTKRQQPRVRLFETGLRFETAGGELVQTPTLALAITGSRGLESWADDRSVVDFFDLKGDVEALLAGAGAAGNLQFKAAESDGLHPGQTAAVLRDGEQIGVIGALHPVAAKSLGVSGDVFVAELDLAAVTKAFVPAFAELSRFPEVKRDLAVIVDRTVASDDLMQNVRSAAGTYLTDLTLFDVYEGKGIDPKRKSLALSLTFREQSRTLNDEEVNQSVQQVIDSLEKNYKAELRG